MYYCRLGKLHGVKPNWRQGRNFSSVSPSGKVKNCQGPAIKPDAVEVLEMFAPNPNRRLRETIFLGAVVMGAAALGAVVLYAATSWLWLVVHQGLR